MTHPRKRRSRTFGRPAEEHLTMRDQHAARVETALDALQKSLANRDKCTTTWGQFKKAVTEWATGSAHSGSAHAGAGEQSSPFDALLTRLMDGEYPRVVAACVRREPLADQGGPDPMTERFKLLDLDGVRRRGLGGGDTYHKQQFERHLTRAEKTLIPEVERGLKSDCPAASRSMARIHGAWKQAEANTIRPRGPIKDRLQALGNKVAELDAQFTATCLRRAPEYTRTEDLDPASTRFALLDLDGARRSRRLRRR